MTMGDFAAERLVSGATRVTVAGRTVDLEAFEQGDVPGLLDALSTAGMTAKWHPADLLRACDNARRGPAASTEEALFWVKRLLA
jgi:hypothetical protein